MKRKYKSEKIRQYLSLFLTLFLTLISLKQCRSSLRLINRSMFFPMYSDNFKNKVFVSSSVRGLMMAEKGCDQNIWILVVGSFTVCPSSRDSFYRRWSYRYRLFLILGLSTSICPVYVYHTVNTFGFLHWFCTITQVLRSLWQRILPRAGGTQWQSYF
jgi:hypothetical protein